MHPLDLTLFALLLGWPLARALGWHRSRVVAMAFAFAVVLWLPVYLALDLLRWPIVPALLLLVAWEVQAVGIMVGDVPPPASRGRARMVSVSLAFAITLPAIALPARLLPRTPPFIPSGSFLAGVADFTWTDSTRIDGGGAPYLLPVRIWFPAEPAPEPRRAERHRAITAFESDLAALLPGRRGPGIVRGFTRAPLRIYTDLRLSTRQRSYPVVILSHGVPGSPALFATLAAELASHGFVVATPEHLGGSLGSVLPGGRYLPPTVTAFSDSFPAGPWVRQAVADGRATLAGLRALAASDSAGRFTGRLLLDSVGWIGQGTGASAAVMLSSQEPVAALVALDPVGNGTDGWPEVPMLTIGREIGTPAPASGAEPLQVEIPGAHVADFTDLAWWSPVLLRRSGLGGEVPAASMQRAIHRLVTTFLGVHLSHERADLRGLAETLPSVRVPKP